MVKVKSICLVIGLIGLVWANRFEEPKDSLEVVGALGFPGNPAEHLFVQDSFAYVVCDSTYGPPRGLRLFVVNVSNPALPETVGSCYLSGSPNEIWVKDTIAYIAAGLKGMQIVNIGSPHSPELIGSFPSPSGSIFTSFQDIEVEDSFAYLACGDSGLYIVNVSNPSEPKLTGRLCLSDLMVSSLSIQGSYAYTTDPWRGTLNIINISEPANSYEVGECFASAGAVAVASNYAYMGDEQFTIVDVSDSTNPNVVTAYPDLFGGINSIFLDSGYTYIAAEYAIDWPERLCGLIILNVSNPSQPALSVLYGGQYEQGQDVFVKDRLVYTCFNYGLLILRHIIAGVEEGPKTQPVAMTLFSNIPNPFRRTAKIQFQLPEQDFVTLKVYDASGRLVKTLIQNRMVEGMHTLYWDGRDNRREPLPTGVYFICLRTAGFSFTKKAILLK